MANFLHNLKRSLALAAAIAVASLTWQATGEPPRFVTDSHGHSYQRQDAFWLQLALLVISSLIQYALAPKPPKPKPAALSEFDIPQSKEGQPICWVFGECYIPDATLASWGNLSSTPIKTKSKKK